MCFAQDFSSILQISVYLAYKKTCENVDAFSSFPGFLAEVESVLQENSASWQIVMLFYTNNSGKCHSNKKNCLLSSGVL